MTRCQVCEIEFESRSPRAKFCSEACKQKNKRMKQIADDISPEARKKLKEYADSVWWDEYDEEPLKGIDTEFAKDRIRRGLPPATFSEKQEKECWVCKKKYKTRLSLMRYCSLSCKDKHMSMGA